VRNTSEINELTADEVVAEQLIHPSVRDLHAPLLLVQVLGWGPARALGLFDEGLNCFRMKLEEDFVEEVPFR
jgi:hypothetical protein